MTIIRTVHLNHEGASLKGQLALPETVKGSLPAVLVMHDAMGLGPFNVERASQLADMGYVALATDMYGDGVHTEEPNEAGKHFVVFHENPGLIRTRVLAWYEHLKSLPEVDPGRIAAIGFCFGGQCVLELARSGEDVKAVVSYHGLLTTPSPAEPHSIVGKVAVYTGSRDPYAPREHVENLREEMIHAGAVLQLTEFSDAYHAFTNPTPPGSVEQGMKYDALCDSISWAGTLTLLSHTLQG